MRDIDKEFEEFDKHFKSMSKVAVLFSAIWALVVIAVAAAVIWGIIEVVQYVTE